MGQQSGILAGWMGCGIDSGKQELGDVGSKSVDNHLGDGASGSGRGIALDSGGSLVELRSDSELLIHGMRFRVFRWQRQGWRNSRGLELQHQELWRELLQLNERMNIRWRWIRGHSGHPVQTRVDALAYRAARSLYVQQKVAA
jgi:hypothetical protein